MLPTGYPETLARNYHYTLRNNPQEHTPHPLRGGRVKSDAVQEVLIKCEEYEKCQQLVDFP
jgi:hypothetical protein